MSDTPAHAMPAARPDTRPARITERSTVTGIVLYAILAAVMVGAAMAIHVAMTLQHMDDRITALESSFVRMECRVDPSGCGVRK